MFVYLSLPLHFHLYIPGISQSVFPSIYQCFKKLNFLPLSFPVSSSPFSTSASLFLSCPRFFRTISFFFFRFHIYVLAYGICFSLSDLLHSV